MKNVLIISSSPRIKGNSDMLCDEFIKGAAENQNHIERINLRDRHIEPCLACDACRKTHRCVQKDDMNEILNQMLLADIIVLASPVYFYSINAVMKLFIDRCFAGYLDLVDKQFIFMLSAADGQREIERATECFKGFTDCLPNSQIIDILYADHCGGRGSIKEHPVLSRAYDLGKGIL